VVNLPKIRPCINLINSNNKGHHYKILEIVSKTWILIVIKIKFNNLNQLSTRLRVFKDHLPSNKKSLR
jgi:hypothetical protein